MGMALARHVYFKRVLAYEQNLLSRQQIAENNIVQFSVKSKSPSWLDWHHSKAVPVRLQVWT